MLCVPCCGDHICQFYKLSYGELLRAQVENRVVGQRDAGGKHSAEGIAQRFPPLAEGGLHYALEKPLVASELADAVARHADNTALDFRRRVEDILIDREKIFHVIPSLEQHAT